MTPNETLAAIEEAWAKVDPLAKQYPFEHSDFTCDRGELAPFHEDVAKYLVLAANHADTLAAELRELRAKMERVRAMLRRAAGSLELEGLDDLAGEIYAALANWPNS